jgi:hypothetical protein
MKEMDLLSVIREIYTKREVGEKEEEIREV